MAEFNYSTFTKKQANILYAAVKREELTMSKANIRKMYNIVGARTLDTDERAFRAHLEHAIEHLFEGRIEFAQLELDGHKVRYECVRRETYMRPYNPDNWFDEPDENGMVEAFRDVYEWVIR